MKLSQIQLKLTLSDSFATLRYFYLMKQDKNINMKRY